MFTLLSCCLRCSIPLFCHLIYFGGNGKLGLCFLCGSGGPTRGGADGLMVQSYPDTSQSHPCPSHPFLVLLSCGSSSAGARGPAGGRLCCCLTSFGKGQILMGEDDTAQGRQGEDLHQSIRWLWGTTPQPTPPVRIPSSFCHDPDAAITTTMRGHYPVLSLLMALFSTGLATHSTTTSELEENGVQQIHEHELRKEASLRPLVSGGEDGIVARLVPLT